MKTYGFFDIDCMVNKHARFYLYYIELSSLISATFFQRCVYVIRYAEFLRLTRAALICQKQYRMVRDRQAYLRVRQAVITIQAYTRGMYTRRIYWEVQKICNICSSYRNI